MEVDLVLEPCIAGGIGRGHVVEPHRRAVGKEDPLPDEERALLSEGDDAVVAADEPRALRDEDVRPVALSRTFSVTWATTMPGRSELRPVTRLAGINVPAASVQGDCGPVRP